MIPHFNFWQEQILQYTEGETDCRADMNRNISLPRRNIDDATRRKKKTLGKWALKNGTKANPHHAHTKGGNLR